MRRPLAIASLLIAALVSPAPFASAEGNARDYIVVLKNNANPRQVANEHARENESQTRFIYEHTLKGYSAHMSEQAANRISNDPRVVLVEADQRVSISAQTTPTGIRRIFASSNSNLDIDATDDLRVDVDVAVLDTGIDYDHPDLNVVHRASCLGVFGSCTSNSGDDGNGHGSHVAGTIGAIDNSIGVVGVAPGARLWAIQVLDSTGSGFTSGVIAGVEYVTARAGQIEVANMSLGGGSSSSLCSAITNSINAGVVHAVAAGNEDQNASNVSPANCSGVITTSSLNDLDGAPGGLAGAGCSDQDDTLSYFSNWGSTIEIAAPGGCIYSTYRNAGYATISGTSMASPHAAGAAALLASAANPQNSSDVAAIRQTLINTGNFNYTEDSGDGIKEPLLDVSNSGVYAPVMVGSQPPDQPPTASITNPTNGSTVSGTVTIQVQASDTEDAAGALTVEVRTDGGVWQAATWNGGTSRYERSWNTTSVADGSHTIDARATDSASNVTNAIQVSVTVNNAPPPPPPGDPWEFAVTGTQTSDRQIAELYWNSGAAPTAKVDIYRDGTKIKRTANDGYYRDVIQFGVGSHTYKVCQAGKQTNCSPTKTVF
ncbi:MAG: S8 family peptidase [Actinomycetota bacterium]